VSDLLNNKIKELKIKKKKDELYKRQEEKKHKEMNKKETDYFKNNFIKHKKKLADLIKLLNKDKDIKWGIKLFCTKNEFRITFSPERLENPHIYLNLYVHFSFIVKELRTLFIVNSEQWGLESPYLPKKFADISSTIGGLDRLEGKWVSTSQGFRAKTKNFKIDEPQKAFDYYIDKIINTSKIDYTNS